jgi:hypothetical protein
MTTLAAILALLPFALGIGQGSAMLKPLAIAIVSGLVFQLPLVFWGAFLSSCAPRNIGATPRVGDHSTATIS